MTRRLAHLARLVAVPSLLALGSLTAPPVSAGDPCFHGFEIPPATTGTGTEIKMMPCAFAPTLTHVAEGTEVTFVNGPDFNHMVTGANQEWGSAEVEVLPGASVSYTFEEPGIYPYACALHVGMSGAIVVGDPGVAAAAPGSVTERGGASTGVGAPAPAPEAAPESEPAPTAATPASIAPVALGVLGGMLVGGGAVWLAIRRRTTSRRSLIHAD